MHTKDIPKFYIMLTEIFTIRKGIMSMKRLLCVFMFLTLIFVLAACSKPVVENTVEPTPTTTPEPKPEAIVFNDSALESKIREAINKPEGEVTVIDAEAVTSLNLSVEWQPQIPEETQIKDISALKYFKNLKELDLTFNLISDISPLAELTGLEILRLGGNQIKEISPLSKLTNMGEFQLWGSREINDISPLAGMVHLYFINMSESQISDISVLANMKELSSIFINDNQITDISPLSGLRLEGLKLNGNPIKDFSPIKDIYPNLIEKDFEIILADDIPDEPIVIPEPQFEAALRTAMNIHDRPITQKDAYLAQSLVIHSEKVPGAQFSDISPLSYFVNLTSLDFNSNHISDLTPLRGLTKLKRLRIGVNRIVDISPLAGLAQLESLDLGANQISDISAIAGMTNLWDLTLWNNQITDVSPIANLKNLKQLQLKDNPISDFSPLKDIYNNLEAKDFEIN